MTRIALAGLAASLALTLSGCASFAAPEAPPRALRGDADHSLARARVAALLAQPLTADSAAEVALINHRGVKAQPGPAQMLTAQMPTTQDAAALAAQARRAFYRAVAAQELLRYAQQVQDSADAATELARRMEKAGNFSALQRMREQAFHADATNQHARARHAVVAGREGLLRALGAADETNVTLPERLPDLPPALPAQPAAEAGSDARSHMREAWSAYRAAYDIARYQRDEIVPLRQRIANENLLRYNGMLISTFELLADAREQVASVTGAIEALREHWLAHTDLQAAAAGVPLN